MNFSHSRVNIGDKCRIMDLRDLDAASLVFAIDQATGSEPAVRDAMALAALAHRHQTRPGRNGAPDQYITHPLRNTLRNIRFECSDFDVLAATALHDTVEDKADELVQLLGGDASAPARDEALRHLDVHFGTTVAGIVDAVSNPQKPANLSPAEKNEHYAAHVTATIADPGVFLVKVSDFLDNAGSLGDLQDADRRNRLRARYVPLVPVFLRAASAHGDALDLGHIGYEQLVDDLQTLASDLEPAAG
ncbi:HD domain-containing protein [Rhodococcus sp. 14-2686-1-2]|nr:MULTISPECIES: HD domain-containing protein [unclassified Rhodococcus (in: high G+C Gram-positive bacteria)]OZE96523.1 HD domain-containing protein [Rhodococcus sp. 15-1189-1-1a]OZF11570.1 HD domain-containing protein [Rhodococcus sp. 14-2686-1-2]